MKACARLFPRRQALRSLITPIVDTSVAVVVVLAIALDVHAQPVTPIAAIQASPSIFTTVTVEGVVTVPIQYRGPTPYTGYIQDLSGRGINLFGGNTAPPNTSALNTIGTRVQVTGEVTVFQGTTVEIVNITNVTSLGTGTVTPIKLSTQAANDSRWEGTLIEVAGIVQSSTITGGARNYVLNNGAGTIVARVYESSLGVPFAPVGTAVIARGAGTNFQGTYWLLVGSAPDFVPGTPPADTAPPSLTGAWASGATELRLTFDESVDTDTGSNPANYSVFETANMGITVPVGNVTVAGPVATLSLLGSLVTGTNYTARVSALSDLTGNTMTSPVLGTFPGPAGPLDALPPSLTSATPTSIRTVTAFFSEPIDSLTGGSPGNYWLFETAPPQNGISITSATVAGASADLEVVLAPGVGYTLRVQGVRDLAGNAIVQPQLASFDVPPALLGIYADEVGSNSQLCAEPNSLTSFFLLARMPVFSPPGVTGANFRIEVLNPAGYVFNYSPPNGAIAIGSPFDLTPMNPNDTAGTTVLFPSCQVASPDPESLVGFGRIDIYNLSGATTTLRVRMKQPPDSPSMPCPRFFLCDAPFNSPICMAPAITSDVVFETTLNAEGCFPPPFLPEMLGLDVHESSDDGAAGPVSTTQALGQSRWFLVTVSGTVSLTNSSSWVAPPNVVCGIPEQSPQTSSPGVTNYWVGADAETNFAAALPPGSNCDALEALGYPRHHQRFECNVGGGFTHPEPLGGAPGDPFPAHQYRYLVQGSGAPATFRWLDAQTSDNYGVLSIRVEGVNPSDVAESTPRPRNFLMLNNAPDPFNPTTVIRYLLPRDASVTVEVYDVRGRAIRRLFNGSQRGGYQSVIWDGLQDNGIRAPSGTYFARVATDVGSSTDRMTLLK